VKKLAIAFAVVVVAACSSRGGGSSGSQTGATSPEAAVNAYMAAMKARDLQAMSAVWGSSRGSVRETMQREQMEKSGTIVMGLMCPDDFKVMGNVAHDDGRRQIRGQMKRGMQSIDLTFVTVQGPGGRWYVEDVPLNGDLPQRLQAFCR
jgi:hypothetical protein